MQLHYYANVSKTYIKTCSALETLLQINPDFSASHLAEHKSMPQNA